MTDIDMGGFENQEVNLTFAGKTYTIELDPPIELYRKFLNLPKKLSTEADWNRVKSFIAELVGAFNDINQKQFKDSLTKIAVTKFLMAYNNLIAGVTTDGETKNVEKQPK